MFDLLATRPLFSVVKPLKFNIYINEMATKLFLTPKLCVTLPDAFGFVETWVNWRVTVVTWSGNEWSWRKKQENFLNPLTHVLVHNLLASLKVNLHGTCLTSLSDFNFWVLLIRSTEKQVRPEFFSFVNDNKKKKRTRKQDLKDHIDDTRKKKKKKNS